ncbi:MAG TPA: ComEC/Rec2 family competence protein, partial [Acidobacteriaceae bacterium]
MRVLGTARFWMDAKPPVEPLRFRRMPLLLAALCFIAGDVLARFLWHTPFALATAAVALLALAIVSIARQPRVAALPVLTLWIAVGCWCAHMQPSVPIQKDLRSYADGLSRVVQGRVMRVRHLQNPPRHVARPARPQEVESEDEDHDPIPLMESVDLRLDAVEYLTPDVSTMVPIEGGVRIAIQGGDPPLACGDIVTVPLQMRVPETYRDPGAWSHPDELLSEGIGVQANVKASAVRRTGAQRASWHCRLYAAQAWASRRLQDFVTSSANRSLPAFARLGEEDAAMLQAMLFGDRTLLSHPLREGFERTGTFHLFVVSGLHVAIVAGALFWLLRRLRLPIGVATLTTVVLTGGYALLTGFGPPVQRAFIMSAAFFIAQWLGRERSPLNALGAAALAVLVLDPRALFESSFQMTMLVIVALAGIAAPLTERWLRRWHDAIHELWTVRLDAALPPRTAQLRVKLRMAGSLCSALLGQWARNIPLWLLQALHGTCAALLFGVAAEICMMLPMALYFHRATLIALPLNAICIPLIGVLLCAAIATFLLSLLSIHAAAVPASITALLLHLVRGIVSHTGHTEIADLRVPMPATIAIITACLAVVWACWSLRLRARLWVATGLAALALVPVAVLWPSRPLLHPGVLEVTALDVGQGDSLFLASPDGHTMLVDA